jgi:hypothetical protein
MGCTQSNSGIRAGTQPRQCGDSNFFQYFMLWRRDWLDGLLLSLESPHQWVGWWRKLAL